MYDPLGLSIGTANLVAARNGSPPVSRRSMLTLYPHCAPKIGAPEDNLYAAEPGVTVKGFVEHIGDPVALVSSDGSAHDPDLLMVEALDALVLAAGADAASSEISIAVPGYWKPSTVRALRDGLRTHAGFVRSGMAPHLVSDTTASLTAVNSEIGLPASGVVGLLDFGGGGTSATLVDVAGDFEIISPTMRYADFSGDEIDQELLLRVFEELGGGSGDSSASTAAVGQLGELREQCRVVKERLSGDVVAEISAELGGRSCRFAVTRDELEDLIQDRLTGFIYAFDDMLVRHRRSWADLAAVVTVGGGARIPLVAERLSVHGRASVLTPSQPALAAACGALMLASRGEALNIRARASIGLLTAASGSDVVGRPAGDVLVIDDEALTDRELAWSQTEYPGDLRVRFGGETYDEDGPAGWSMRLNVIEAPRERLWRRLRLSQLIIGLSALVAMTAIGGVAYTLTGIENRQAPPTPSVMPLPAPPVSSRLASPVQPPPTATPPAPSAEPVPSSAPPPPPEPSPPPTSAIVTTAPPIVTTRHPSPSATQRPTTTAITTTPPPPSAITTTSAPPPTAAQTPTTSTTVEMTTEWIHVPLLPVPIPIPVPKNQVPQNQAPQYQAPQNQAPQYQAPQYQAPQYQAPQYQAPQYQAPQYPWGSQNPFLGPGY